MQTLKTKFSSNDLMIKKHVYKVCWNGKAGKGENQTAVQKGTQMQQETGKKQVQGNKATKNTRKGWST